MLIFYSERVFFKPNVQVANPSILFLDEPTSGLDSRAAQIVMRSVTNIVSSGRSVICTIHQPSRRLFLYFSHLLLLKRGGEVAYFGPIGEQAKDLLVCFISDRLVYILLVFHTHCV